MTIDEFKNHAIEGKYNNTSEEGKQLFNLHLLELISTIENPLTMELFNAREGLLMCEREVNDRKEINATFNDEIHQLIEDKSLLKDKINMMEMDMHGCQMHIERLEKKIIDTKGLKEHVESMEKYIKDLEEFNESLIEKNKRIP